MDITLTALDSEPLPEPSLGFIKKEKHLLNSNFKAAEAQNFTESSETLFNKRQHLKFKQFNSINAIGVALKLSIFVIVLSMIV